MKEKNAEVMVVGAGVSGIRCALDLASCGCGVILVDRRPYSGGLTVKLDRQFPSNRCGICKMLPHWDGISYANSCMRRGFFHENIEFLYSSRIGSIEGEAGNFKVSLIRAPDLVDPVLCIGCGECERVCPETSPASFNCGFSSRKAVSLASPYALKNRYVIDPEVCTFCGACEEVCPTGAISLKDRNRFSFRVLVIDDEKIVRDSMKEWLVLEGYDADTASSGPEALECMESGVFHLLLLDVKMPGMDGVEVLEEALKRDPDVKVLMMTAYAAVETAVEAMKLGALDYVIKPFVPEDMIRKVDSVYQESGFSPSFDYNVKSVVFSGGAGFYDPSEGLNTFGYGSLPQILTSLEFERVLCGLGPTGRKLINPVTGRDIKRVAWIQCVGSRDLQEGKDYCSGVCCMVALKQALLVREISGGAAETEIFHMDMRTFGKGFQEYRDNAEKHEGVVFHRARIHSAFPAPEDSEFLQIHYTDLSGNFIDTRFDLLVLSIGQVPDPDMADLSGLMGVALNRFGFAVPKQLLGCRTDREGLFVGSSGFQDLGDSVILGSSAAMCASRVVHRAGGFLKIREVADLKGGDLCSQSPDILAIVCNCHGTIKIDVSSLLRDPLVGSVREISCACNYGGRDEVAEHVNQVSPNRVLLGACKPFVQERRRFRPEDWCGLPSSMVEVVDIRDHHGIDFEAVGLSALKNGVAFLKRRNPCISEVSRVERGALVLGGGVSGMTAALAMADHGYPVFLVEKGDCFGGQLNWLGRTLEGEDLGKFLVEICGRVESHPKIASFLSAEILDSSGRVGDFKTTVLKGDGGREVISHGVTVIAVGGRECADNVLGFERLKGVITQKEFEEEFGDGGNRGIGGGSERDSGRSGKPDSVVFIQCAGTRSGDKNYCSRVCCSTTLKQALGLKERDSGTAVYVLYRDIMSFGFLESWYTRARQAGVLFFRYSLNGKPKLVEGGEHLSVMIHEEILGRELCIDADLVVLAMGLESGLSHELSGILGVSRDRFGFFQEAESKWRPMESMKDGIFACGICHSPRSVNESVIMAEGAAMKALSILSRERLVAEKEVAVVRHAYCCECELCITACPYGARYRDEESGRIMVHHAACRGCGACTTVCPSSASSVEGFSARQILEVLDHALK